MLRVYPKSPIARQKLAKLVDDPAMEVDLLSYSHVTLHSMYTTLENKVLDTQ